MTEAFLTLRFLSGWCVLLDYMQGASAGLKVKLFKSCGSGRLTPIRNMHKVCTPNGNRTQNLSELEVECADNMQQWPLYIQLSYTGGDNVFQLCSSSTRNLRYLCFETPTLLIFAIFDQSRSVKFLLRGLRGYDCAVVRPATAGCEL